jgi:hypothetical protein
VPIPLPVIPGVARVTLNWITDNTSQHAVNVIHIAAPSTPPVQADVFEALQDAVSTNMWIMQSSHAVIDTVDVLNLDGSSAVVSFPTGHGAVWSGSGDAAWSPQVAALVKLQTGVRGRSNRGRVYLPFVANDSVTDGTLNGANVALAQTAWTNFLTTLAGDPDGPFPLVVAAYDRRHGGAGAGATNVSHVVFESEIGTQRRRQERNR